MQALTQYLNPLEINLQNLYLDPNNPRFQEYASDTIPDIRFKDPSVQSTALSSIRNKHSSDKLMENMKVNGYLPIDRIVVRRIDGSDDDYVVLEGNRRIAAAKTLRTESDNFHNVDDAVLNSISKIPCLVYSGDDENAAWLFQGLRHITGIQDWSAFHKAKLLVEQMERDSISLTEVGKRFGLSMFGAGQWVRGYYAFKQAAEDTDYTDVIDQKLYPYVQELFGRSNIALRDWLGWNEDSKSFANLPKYDAYIGLFYPREEGDHIPEGEVVAGNWEERRITQRDDIRKLSNLLSSGKSYFQDFLNGERLDDVYSRYTVDKLSADKEEKSTDASYVMRQVNECIDALKNIPLVMIKDNSLKVELYAKLDDLEKKIAFVRD